MGWLAMSYKVCDWFNPERKGNVSKGSRAIRDRIIEWPISARMHDGVEDGFAREAPLLRLIVDFSA